MNATLVNAISQRAAACLILFTGSCLVSCGDGSSADDSVAAAGSNASGGVAGTSILVAGGGVAGESSIGGAPGGSGGVRNDSGGSAGAAGGGGMQMQPLPIQDPLAGLPEPELIAQGYEFVEGVRWIPNDGRLLYADVYGEQFYELIPPAEPTPVDVGGLGWTIGFDLDPQGRIVAAADNDSVVRLETNGSQTQLFADTPHMLTSANDLVVLSDGTVYVSDLQQGVFEIAPGGGITKLDGVAAGNNGIENSADEQAIFIGFQSDGRVERFARDAQGTLSQGEPFATLQTPDGMCSTLQGDLLISTTTGFKVYDSEGQLWGDINLPLNGGDRGTNCAFGGAELKTLYMLARSKVFRVELPVAGAL